MSSVLDRYAALVAAGELRADPEQAVAARCLDSLAIALEATPKRGSTLWRALGRKPASPRGVYLWGGVGRGKSMLMDLFFSQLAIRRKRRVHFAEFMLEVHQRIAAERAKEAGDPIAPVAAALAEETRVLAFDEMMVTNSPDAMILSRLFTALIEAGVTVVTTSNRPPRDLYKDGLNREHFLPFIDLIGSRLDVLALNGPVDYRRDRLGVQEAWLVPNGPAATAELSAAFFRLTDYPPEDREHVPAEDIDVQG
ncbi:MAG: cell division protein ZapE, partial [Sphingomonas sp.]